MKTRAKISFVIGCVFLTMVSSTATAVDNATIRNKSFDERRKEVDASVVVKKVNGLEMEADQSEVDVSAGERTLELECTVRTFVGMGTVDIGKLKQITVPLEAGHTYQLGAKLSPDGECTPTID
jgi:hypothetical protein